MKIFRSMCLWKICQLLRCLSLIKIREQKNLYPLMYLIIYLENYRSGGNLFRMVGFEHWNHTKKEGGCFEWKGEVTKRINKFRGTQTKKNIGKYSGYASKRAIIL